MKNQTMFVFTQEQVYEIHKIAASIVSIPDEEDRSVEVYDTLHCHWGCVCAYNRLPGWIAWLLVKLGYVRRY